MIYLEPQGGLANRIRVIANGIWLKRQLDTSLYIIWNENNELNCPFHLLFEPIDDFVIIKPKSKFNLVTRSNQPSVTGRLKAKIKNFLAGVDYCVTDEDAPHITLYDFAKKHDRIYIKTCQRFTESLTEFKILKPVSLINNKINQFLDSIGNSKLIGVQIRGTDHLTAKENSPVNLFIGRMHELIAGDKAVLFFLATDEPTIETELKRIFADKIITLKKELSRQTITGMQDAVFDFFVLSKTVKILGSYWSSFSEVAAWIGDTELEVIKKD